MIDRLRVPLDDPERAALEAEVAAEANEAERKAKVSDIYGKVRRQPGLVDEFARAIQNYGK